MKLQEAVGQFVPLMNMGHSTFTEYGWKCYGPDCFFYDLLCQHTKFEISFVFKAQTFEIMEVTIINPEHPYAGDGGDFDNSIAWIHPDFREVYFKEEMERLNQNNTDPFIDINLEEVLAKARKVLDAARHAIGQAA